MAGNEFSVPGSSITIKDGNRPRGKITAQLMGGELGDGFQGQEAQRVAEELISLGVKSDQLKFTINKLGKTPQEAVEYLKNSNNRLQLIAKMTADKGIELPSYFHD